MPVEFECKDIGNQNCGFKAEADTPEELITKVNQHVRSAHGINPTDAQERVERAIKEKESWRTSGNLMGETGSKVPTNIGTGSNYGETSSWNQPSSQGMEQEQTMSGGPGSTYQSGSQPGQPGWQTQRFGQQQGEQYRQTGQEASTSNQYYGQTGTQSQMNTETPQYGSNTPSQRGRNGVSETTTSQTEQEDEEE
jgi:predicted small metal-binding protein